jgi:arylsulfatase A-like enzyme
MARPLARGLAVAAVVVGAAGCGRELRPTPPAGPGPRHVVVVSLDTTRADHFGLYGSRAVRTPRLDALAAESIVLDDLMTVVPTTLASHVSLFTGNYPHAHGVPRNGFLVDERNEMLPEILRERGFTTAGFAASFALESRFNFAQGFDHYDETFERLAGTEGRLQNERPAGSVTLAVVEWLETVGVPERLFLFVHYFDPHAPYEPPPPYDTRYDPRGREGLPEWKSFRPEGLAQVEPTEDARRMALQYAGEIGYLDEQVGVMLDALRGRGVLDEALLLVTSDHGETFWEHPGSFDHGWSTYETTMRAVGLLRLPGARHGGARIAGVAATIDLTPTLLALLGIPAPAGIDGEAIPLDPPPARLDRVRYGQATKPWREVETDPRWTNMLKERCVREGRYKLIQVPYAGREELYDVEADPAEQTDLLAAGRAEARAVADRLRPRLEAWAASARPLPSRFEPSQRAETLERLRALGYVEGDE